MSTTEKEHQYKLKEIREEAVLKFAEQAHRSCIMVNGGAAVGILTFYGNLVSDGGGNSQISTGSITVALIIFSIGALSAALSTGATYLAQLRFKEERQNDGNFWRFTSIIISVIAYGLFSAGLIVGALAFN